jgi:hypothetical protein
LIVELEDQLTADSPRQNILPVELHLEWTERRSIGKFAAMGQPARLTCPKCGANLTLALPPSGKGQRTFTCFDCERSDPLKTDRAMRWIESGLQPLK